MNVLLRSALLAALVVAVMAALPEAAFACPVCFDSNEENRIAFLATTAFLTLLPLGLVGGIGAWLRKRARDIEAQGLLERGEAPRS